MDWYISCSYKLLDILATKIHLKLYTLWELTISNVSFLASLGVICRPIGALVEGYVVDRYGRKTTMQIVSILIAMSWLLTYFSQSVTLLYISRILLSYALGELFINTVD